jgi:hypothetical protein
MPRDYLGTALQANGSQVLTRADKFTVGGVVLDPAGARDMTMWRAPFACTVTNVRARRRGGTGASVNARKNTSALLASNLSVATADTWTDGGAVQNQSFALGDELELRVISITGAVTELSFVVEFTRA